MVGFSIQINGLSDCSLDLEDGGFRKNAIKSKHFSPSKGTLVAFVIVESWTAREKRGHPARAVAWNDWAFRPSVGTPSPYVFAKASIKSISKPPSVKSARRPRGGRRLWDRHRPFTPKVRGAILSGCLAHAPLWAFCPMTFTFRSSLGLVSVGRRSTTCLYGPSLTIGPPLCRLPTPSSMCSRHGSAICSMNCSGRALDLGGQSR